MATFEGPPPWLLDELRRASDKQLPFEDRVRAADRSAKLIEQYLVDIICDGLFFEGRSWTDVGNALGVTRQAAFQRFSRKTKANEKGQG